MTSERVHTHTHYTFSRTHTHKHAVRAGNKSKEMLMPTNTLGRSCVALNWSLSHTHTHTGQSQQLQLAPSSFLANAAALTLLVWLTLHATDRNAVPLLKPVLWLCFEVIQMETIHCVQDDQALSFVRRDQSCCVYWRVGLSFLDCCVLGISASEVFLSELLNTDTVRVQHETAASRRLYNYYTIVKSHYAIIESLLWHIIEFKELCSPRNYKANSAIRILSAAAQKERF